MAEAVTINNDLVYQNITLKIGKLKTIYSENKNKPWITNVT